MTMQIIKEINLGKDGKSYTNLVLQFIENDLVVFQTIIDPKFELSSKAYSKYLCCIGKVDQ